QLNREKYYIALPPYVPENLVSRDWFSRPVPRQPAHDIPILRLNLVLTYFGIPPEFRGGVHYETDIRHRVGPEFIGSPRNNCVPMAFTVPRARRRSASSKPQGSSERVLPWQATIDQLICASLSHVLHSSISTSITPYSVPLLSP
ncbi:unnamed protein product, partial [Ascophyllum nodosum]